MRLRCGRDGFAPDTAPDQTNGAVAILALLDSRQDGATSFCFSESARAAAISSDPFSAVSFSVDERERGRRHQTADHHDRQGCRISASGQVAKRNGTFAAIRRLRLIDEADQIAPTHIAEHGRETLAVFADHLDRAVLDDDLGDLRELHRSAIGNHHRDPRRIGGGCALAILVANDQRRAHLSFQNDAEIATIDPDAQRLLHLLGVSGRAARPCRERP